jgi:hypothetical protein
MPTKTKRPKCNRSDNSESQSGWVQQHDGASVCGCRFIIRFPRRREFSCRFDLIEQQSLLCGHRFFSTIAIRIPARGVQWRNPLVGQRDFVVYLPGLSLSIVTRRVSEEVECSSLTRRVTMDGLNRGSYGMGAPARVPYDLADSLRAKSSAAIRAVDPC